MKIALFADIHGNKEALDAILEDCYKKNIKQIYSLGDVLGIGPSPIECVQEILDNKIHSCLGNHELYLLERQDEEDIDKGKKEYYKWVISNMSSKMKTKIGGMTLSYDIPIESGSLCLLHFPMSQKTYQFYDLHTYRKVGNALFENSYERYEKVYFGHEHNPIRIDDKFINISTSGCVHGNNTYYTILDLDTLETELVTIPFDREKLDKKLQLGYPNSDIYKRYFGIK